MTTATTLAHDVLEGTLVRCWPYQRGLYARDALYHLWKMMEDEGGAQPVFYGRQDGIGATYPLRGDLTDFVKLFDAPDRLLFVVQRVAEADIVGLWWLDDIVRDHRAACNLFFRRRAWGPAAAEATRLIIDWAFEHLTLQQLWAYTPWTAAVTHGERAGFQVVARLPDFVLMGDQLRELVILRLRREDWDGRQGREL